MKKDIRNIAERMRESNIPGLSIAFISEGKLSHHECWGEVEAGSGDPIQSNTLFNACSISKFAASILALQLVEEGLLSLDEDVGNFLISWNIPEHPSFNSRTVTLRRLLCHQAGFADPQGGFGQYIHEYGSPDMAKLLRGMTYYCQKPIELMAEPGSQFIYSDTGFCIIQLMIEDVTGESFDKLLQEKLFEPLHMNNSIIVTSQSEIRMGSAVGHNKHGVRLKESHPIYPYPAAAGLWTTPADLALLVEEFLSSLQGNSRLGISAETADEMIKPQGCFKWTGLGVFLESPDGELEVSSLGWGAGYQCMLITYPKIGRGAVLMMNADPGVHQTQSLLGHLASLWQQGQLI
ncbi:penicillin-binding protein [Paenibacillus sp. J23TS9]|uniref:serine hydrolase domain-containing protein n=1 Tax=Paenibacillus sp. J23TS9 TaxID=2807193 RepID=UPI001B20AAB4|nr:serine hydrolase domain-containing protein [Paenibacillus sp. J23TS9]GIP25884.1 penicillin-binding protein [Paenibacillus sp. J23TS9]